MNLVPHAEDLPTYVPPANWREFSIHEEEDCMEGSWTSADPSYIHKVLMNHTILSKWSLLMWYLVKYAEATSRTFGIKTAAVEFAV